MCVVGVVLFCPFPLGSNQAVETSHVLDDHAEPAVAERYSILETPETHARPGGRPTSLASFRREKKGPRNICTETRKQSLHLVVSVIENGSNLVGDLTPVKSSTTHLAAQIDHAISKLICLWWFPIPLRVNAIRDST